MNREERPVVLAFLPKTDSVVLSDLLALGLARIVATGLAAGIGLATGLGVGRVVVMPVAVAIAVLAVVEDPGVSQVRDLANEWQVVAAEAVRGFPLVAVLLEAG